MGTSQPNRILVHLNPEYISKDNPGLMEEKEFREWLDAQRRSIDLELTDEGTWLHNKTPFAHHGLIGAFNRGIELHPDTKEPIVRIGTTWCYFRSRMSPFIVERLIAKGTLLQGVQLNTGEQLTLETITPVYAIGKLSFSTTCGRTLRMSRRAQANIAPFLSQSRNSYFLETEYGLRHVNIED